MEGHGRLRRRDHHAVRVSRVTITLSGLPMSTNHLYVHRGQAVYMVKDGHDRKEQYQWEAKNQWQRPRIAAPTPIDISVDLYFNSKHRRDIDNYHKISLDSLTGIVWDDDSQIRSMIVSKRYDATNPRIEITIL